MRMPGKRLWGRIVPRSLAGQLVAVLVVALVATQLAGFVIYSDESRSILRTVNRDDTVSRTASVVRILAATPGEVHGEVVAAATSRRLRFWLGDAPAATGGPGGFAEKVVARRLRRSTDLPEASRIHVGFSSLEARFHERHAHGGGDRGRRHDDDDREWRHWDGPAGILISVELAGGRWFNAEGVFLSPYGQGRQRTWAFLVSSILIVSVVSVLMLRRITRPMGELADAANRLGRGEDVGPLPETGPREARATTRAFNEMRARLKRFIDDRTHMLAATGHDLRTPLTSLRLRAEMVEDSDIRDNMLRTLDEMRRMTEAMLDFARGDAEREETRDVDLNALVASVTGDLADMGLKAEFAEGGAATIRCRPFALTRALRNLIENGARHGGGARVSVAGQAGAVEILIEDDGPGIPDDRLEHVFDPFVRLDEARGQESGGMGLGLGIARTVIHAHGGEVTVANKAPSGLVVKVALPV